MDAAQDLGEQVAAGSRPVTAAAAVSSATGADEPASAEECLDIAVADTEDALELLAAAAGGEETASGSTLTRTASVAPAEVAGVAAAHVTSRQPATARAAATRTVREGALPRPPAAAGAAGTSAAAAGARSAGALHSAAAAAAAAGGAGTGHATGTAAAAAGCPAGVGAQVVQRPAAAGAGAQGLVSIGQGALAAGGGGPVQPGPLLGYASRHEDTPCCMSQQMGERVTSSFPTRPRVSTIISRTRSWLCSAPLHALLHRGALGVMVSRLSLWDGASCRRYQLEGVLRGEGLC